MSVSVLAKNTCETVGEGPHWLESEQSLLYVDLVAGYVHKYNTITGQDESRKFDAPVTLVVPSKSHPGCYVIGLDRKLVCFNWESGDIIQEYCEVEKGKNTRFNDGKCDVSGRLWAGTMAYETSPAVLEKGAGSLYSIEQNGSPTLQRDKITISNGIAWTADNRTMYFIDTLTFKVSAFDFNLEAGTIANERTAVDLKDQKPGFPDGMCIDEEGKLWVAMFLGSCVHRCDPDTGNIMQTIKFPVPRMTSCCFGGKNYDELFVTSSRTGQTEEEDKQFPLAGSVFKVTGLGVKGTPPNSFSG